jgi:hypothetical protein
MDKGHGSASSYGNFRRRSRFRLALPCSVGAQPLIGVVVCLSHLSFSLAAMLPDRDRITPWVRSTSPCAAAVHGEGLFGVRRFGARLRTLFRPLETCAYVCIGRNVGTAIREFRAVACSPRGNCRSGPAVVRMYFQH